MCNEKSKFKLLLNVTLCCSFYESSIRTQFLKRQRGPVAYFWRSIPINKRTGRHRIGVGFLAGYIGEAMDKPPFSLAFVMVTESFVVLAIFFYLESAANKR